MGVGDKTLYLNSMIHDLNYEHLSMVEYNSDIKGHLAGIWMFLLLLCYFGAANWRWFGGLEE